MTELRGRRLRTYRQGEFDGLCGVYAIINAVRLAAAAYRHLPRSACAELFATLTAELDGREGLHATMTDGIVPQQMARLLACADAWLQGEYRLVLQVRRPFVRHGIDAEQSLRRLGAH